MAATRPQSKCPHSASTVEKATQCGGSISDDPQLPLREIVFYIVVLASIITYAGYGFYLAYGKDPAAKLPVDLLRVGWMREYKDVSSDYLLDSMVNNWRLVLLAAVGYLFVSKATLLLTPMPCHHIACAAYTLALTALSISPQVSVLMATLYVATLFLSYYSYATICVVICTGLYVHNVQSALNYIAYHLVLTNSNIDRYSASWGYLLCRLLSVGHSLRCRLAQRRQSGEPMPTLFEHIRDNLPPTLHYAFFMPYHWCGPILTYEMFREQLATRGRVVAVSKSTAICAAWRACRMVLWYFVLELIFHYLPVGSYLYSLHEEDQIVYKHLSFSMFLHGQNFMLLYVQFYGWPGLLAKLDGIELPHWPDCISWVYSYTIMWRAFDRGLFFVMQAHIYRPLGGSKSGILRQILGVIVSFAFICVFHGDSSNVRAWVTLNAMQLIIERLAMGSYKKLFRSTVTKYLSPTNEKRLVGYVISWNMMVSCGVIFFFLAGQQGFIVMPEFLLLRGSASRHTPVWHMLTGQTATYCCVQIGRFYESKMKGGCLVKAWKDGLVGKISGKKSQD